MDTARIAVRFVGTHTGRISTGTCTSTVFEWSENFSSWKNEHGWMNTAILDSYLKWYRKRIDINHEKHLWCYFVNYINTILCILLLGHIGLVVSHCAYIRHFTLIGVLADITSIFQGTGRMPAPSTCDNSRFGIAPTMHLFISMTMLKMHPRQPTISITEEHNHKWAVL